MRWGVNLLINWWILIIFDESWFLGMLFGMSDKYTLGLAFRKLEHTTACPFIHFHFSMLSSWPKWVLYRTCWAMKKPRISGLNLVFDFISCKNIWTPSSHLLQSWNSWLFHGSAWMLKESPWPWTQHAKIEMNKWACNGMFQLPESQAHLACQEACLNVWNMELQTLYPKKAINK
jgi:hypothetical protein